MPAVSKSLAARHSSYLKSCRVAKREIGRRRMATATKICSAPSKKLRPRFARGESFDREYDKGEIIADVEFIAH